MAVPEPRPAPLLIELADEAATAALARRVAFLAERGDVIALTGDLGAGKTSFARAFINALPHVDPARRGADEEVPSPTFTLVQVYDREPAPVWHFDLYRLERPDEAYELGLEEALAEGITLIEWPERLGALIPSDRLEIRLDFARAPDARTAWLTPAGGWTRRLERLRDHGRA